MDNFLDFLVKKADLNNNEYFNYKKTKPDTAEKSKVPLYDKILEPSARDYVVFDLETTGMKPFSNKIIEIGAVKVIKGEITDTFSSLVNPGAFVPPYISNITHITNEMLRGERYIEEVLPDFVDFIENLPLIAHNARFDMSFLITNAARLNIKMENSVIDTLYLSRKYNKECEKHNLAYLTEFFNIKLENAHRAYYDALATNELYKIIQRKY